MSLGGGAAVYSHSIATFQTENECWRAADAAIEGMQRVSGGQDTVSAECVKARDDDKAATQSRMEE